MSNLVFPSSPISQAWPIIKTPMWSTRIQRAVSGREVRVQQTATPTWMFDLPFDVLSDGAGFANLPPGSYQNLVGFYNVIQAAADTFLYVDPSDAAVTGQSLGVANGTQTDFVFTHSFGGYSEPVGLVNSGSVAVYINGAAAPAGGGGSAPGWSIIAPNILSFAFAPASGRVITADYGLYYVCRFTDDKVDFRYLMQGIWSADSIKFQSAKP